MSAPTTSIGFSASTPAAAAGFQIAQPQTDGGSPQALLTFEVPNAGGVAVKTANYTALAGDCGKLLSFNSSTAVTLTLPAAPPFAQWTIAVENVGAGALIVARNGLTIDAAAANLTLAQNSGVGISTDAANYFTQRGVSVAAGAVGSLTTTGTSGAATLASGVLNIPVYSAGAAGGGLFAPLLTSIPTLASTGLSTSLAGTSGFTAANVATGVSLIETGNSSGLEGRVMAYPGTAFTATALVSVDPGATNFSAVGFVASQSLTAKQMLFAQQGVSGNSSSTLVVSSWSVPATFVANIQGPSTIPSAGGYVPFIWLRYQDNGTSVIFSYSYDGIFFRQFYTVAKASSYLGSGNFNYFGVVLISGNSAFGNGIVLQSWTLTTP